VATLQTLLEESVELHCIADAGLATACSAGVDSGLITALAKRYRPELRGYVIDQKLGHSEARDAERTGRHVGVDLRRVPFDKDRFLELWPRAIWHLETDGWHASHSALLALAEQCRADGVKVLLTGEGSDELFGGYRWQASTMRLWRQSWLRRLFQSKARRDRKFAELRRTPFRNSIGRGSPSDRTMALRALSPELNFLQIKLFDKLEGLEPLDDRAFLASCFYDLYSHLQDLLHRHDRLSMAASVELRVPFLENHLIDFALHLPRRQKYRDGTGKWLLKKVAEHHLPHENIRAAKIGFDMADAFSAGAQGMLRGGLLRDAMKWSSCELDDLIDMARSQETSRLRLVGMEMLLRLYMNGETTGGLTEALHAETRNAK